MPGIIRLESEKKANERLNALLAAAGEDPLADRVAEAFDVYLSLILRWNARTNLTAIRDREGILSRHFVESIACARALPEGIAALLDFGSGAGLPGIPIALCRPEIQVTLAESQGKKAAFLREAVRILGISAQVHGARAEALEARFDCVTMRAVDHMEAAVRAAAKLVAPKGLLAPVATLAQVETLQAAAGPAFEIATAVALPGIPGGVVALMRKLPAAA